MNNTIPNWLKNIRDDKYITELCIPGSHDTMTSMCEDVYYKTQSLSLSEQLNIGLRFFDFRITRNLVAAHREWISDITATSMFDELVTFLDKNPSEFIIIRLQNANENKDDFDQYKVIIQEFIANYLDSIFTPKPNERNTYDWPSVGEARGKIIVIDSSDPSLNISTINNVRWAYNWHDNDDIILQDNWDGPKLKNKIRDIEEVLPPSNHNNKDLILNHISATNGYLGNPVAYAELVNPIIEDRIEKIKDSSGVGILIYDFVYDSVAAKTIDANEFI
ncbi:1-phosphatidylinositol phosphodiesterase [Vibrio sp. MACH09]|uniref:phosphatidylinositol-specific phospholipase C domain-containing protein n=1 Tax=Vibrio sp. MACH09 TaxID=3025122 RepID=UPI0027901CE4|nr:phosphatidylinositol-specific phospholipase C domain-containing protein [Vibrio sp. MACH09]GLO63480.1 1-phosphatidylinositol phosphodiesterase [Vibrio sp. MACH09]